MPMSTILQRASYQIYNQQDCAALHEEGSINHSNICAGQLGAPIGQCYDKYFQFHIFAIKIN